MPDTRCRWTFHTGARADLRCELPAGHLGPWHRHDGGQWIGQDYPGASQLPPEPEPEPEPEPKSLTVADAIAVLRAMVAETPDSANLPLRAYSGRTEWGEPGTGAVIGFSMIAEGGDVWVDV